MLASFPRFTLLVPFNTIAVFSEPKRPIVNVVLAEVPSFPKPLSSVRLPLKSSSATATELDTSMMVYLLSSKSKVNVYVPALTGMSLPL